MECVKTEPDPDGELYSSSWSDYQPNGIKEDEDDPLLIRCPLMKTENEVSRKCLRSYVGCVFLNA
jgi:hypothetical protein